MQEAILPLRRAILAGTAALALACEPSVPYAPGANPSALDFAAFDPAGSPPSIPLPNDLALQPQAIATQNPAQGALLLQWQTEGFPNDQEIPITIDFVRETLDPATGVATRSAPPIDTASIGAASLLLLSISSSASGPVAYDSPHPSDYVVNGDHGTLTLRKSVDPSSGSRRWPAGTTIVVAVRGGTNGVKVIDGSPGGLQPQPAMYLLLQDQILTLPENLGIIPGNSQSEKMATATQLEALRKQYLAPFAAIDATGAFHHREIATLGTFRVAGTTRATHVETDPGAGLMPLPSDFLLGPDGHLLPELAAPAGPFGPAGAGLATLDGFSTTAMILMSTSAPVDASSVHKDSIFLYEMSTPQGGPPSALRLPEANELAHGRSPRFAAEPAAITQVLNGRSVSTAIGLQPGVPAQLPDGSVWPIPPLKEGTTHVVLVTRRVKDMFGDPLVRSTLGKILLLDPSISISANGKSQISGISAAQAAALDQMRQAINLAAAALASEKGVTRDDLAMAYTFRTQTMKSTAVQLAALPYANPTAALTGSGTQAYCPAANPACAAGTVANALARYGVDPARVPGAHVFAVVESTITTFNKLLCPGGATGCSNTGAFTPTAVAPSPEPIAMLVALPAPPYGSSACVPSPTQVCTIPLVIFRHGLSGGRGDLFHVADAFNAKGIAVAAIDAAKHGDRSFCKSAAECSAGGSCTPVAGLAGEGDATPPGKCSSDFVRRPVTSTGAPGPAGIPIASGNYLISANLFRTRDTLRQDLIDQSQLLRVLSPNPACDRNAPPTDAARTCANQIVTPLLGVQFDPDQLWMIGQSLGAISGTLDVAANPRLGKAALNVGGSTLVDVVHNSPSLGPALDGLLAALGIEKGTPDELRFLQVAKWILDPADAENFATNLSAQTLPSPISGNVAPPPRAVLGQLALCDPTVPNAFNLNLYGLSGLGPSAAEPGKGTVTTFVAGGGGACPANAVLHGFLTGWVDYGSDATSIAQQAQDDIADFFIAGSLPPSTRSAP